MRHSLILGLIVVAGCTGTNGNVLTPNQDLSTPQDQSLGGDDGGADLASCSSSVANPGSALSCSPGADAGTDPCVDGRTFESPPSCCTGTIASYCGTSQCRSYSDEVASLRQPNTCGSFPNGKYGMVRTGVCGPYHFIETQGLGLGVIIHRFYDQAGNLIGAQTRDDIAGKCYQSYGVIPQCQLLQCELICYGSGYTC